MARFDAAGFRIDYDDLGSGAPIVLLHGFSADRKLNWKRVGWYRALTGAGFRVIAADARGHGRSQLSGNPEDYSPEGIAGDTLRLLDHLGLDEAYLFGYSMGGRNSAWLLSRHSDRFTAAIIGGTGLNLLAPEDAAIWEERGYPLTPDNEPRDSLARPKLTPLLQRAHWLGRRAAALSACLRGGFPSMTADELSRITTPTLVICGEKDSVSGSPIPLAASIPGAKAVIAPGKSHLTAIADPFVRGAVLGFLGEQVGQHEWAA